MFLSGPVAAAKNRSARNFSLSKSKQEALLSPEVVVSDDTALLVNKDKKKAGRKKTTKRSTRAVLPLQHRSKQQLRTVDTGDENHDEMIADIQSQFKDLPKGKKAPVYSKLYPFSYKVYDLLQNSVLEDYEDIVSYTSDGKAFVIHDRVLFSERILPVYFGHSNMRSFERQCSYWGLTRCLDEKKKTKDNLFAWFHPCLQRGRSDLLRQIKRVAKKDTGTRKKGVYINLRCETKEDRETKKKLLATEELDSKKDSKKKTMASSICLEPATPSRPSRTNMSAQAGLNDKSLPTMDQTPRIVSPVDDGRLSFSGKKNASDEDIFMALLPQDTSFSIVPRRVSEVLDDTEETSFLPFNPVETAGDAEKNEMKLASLGSPDDDDAILPSFATDLASFAHLEQVLVGGLEQVDDIDLQEIDDKEVVMEGILTPGLPMTDVDDDELSLSDEDMLNNATLDDIVYFDNSTQEVYQSFLCDDNFLDSYISDDVSNSNGVSEYEGILVEV